MYEMENPGTNKTIRALISRCAGMVVLIDLVQVVADGQGQELFAMQLLSYLDALRPGRKKSRKVEVPVAVVFTKADLFEEWIGDPEAFARGNVSGLHGAVPGAAGTVRVLLLGCGRARPQARSTTRARRAWSRSASSLAGSSSRSRGWSTRSVSRTWGMFPACHRKW